MYRILAALLLVAFTAFSAQAAGPNKGGYAAVDSEGKLKYGHNIRKVELIDDGRFSVKFKKSITGCFLQATSANHTPQSKSTSISITVTVFVNALNPKVARVLTYSNYNDALQSWDFFLEAKCL